MFRDYSRVLSHLGPSGLCAVGPAFFGWACHARGKSGLRGEYPMTPKPILNLQSSIFYHHTESSIIKLTGTINIYIKDTTARSYPLTHSRTTHDADSDSDSDSALPPDPGRCVSRIRPPSVTHRHADHFPYYADQFPLNPRNTDAAE